MHLSWRILYSRYLPLSQNFSLNSSVLFFSSWRHLIHKQSAYLSSINFLSAGARQIVQHWQLVISPDLHSNRVLQRGQDLCSCVGILLSLHERTSRLVPSFF